MRRWHIIGGTTWAMTEPWQHLGTAKPVQTFTDRNQAIHAMRAALNDPAWEPPDDPPEDKERELKAEIDNLKAEVAALRQRTETVERDMTAARTAR